MSSPSLTLFDIVPGRKVADRYTVVGASRQGGFSTAFEVTDGEDGSRCELQLFPSGLFEADGQVHEFHERLQPWMEIESPAVLRVRDVVEIDADNLALITALPTGESLRERLNRETVLPREEVLAIGRRLLEGLVSIHARDMIHGDIKPFTIHLEGTGAEALPVLVDGGVTPGLWTAKHLGDKTALIGTPYYAPVEQFGGDAPDVRSDIYNIATVLFECATGVLPWAGKTFLEIFQSKLQDPPPASQRAPNAPIDADLEAAIRKGCLADRHKRYANATEFLAALSL